MSGDAAWALVGFGGVLVVGFLIYQYMQAQQVRARPDAGQMIGAGVGQLVGGIIQAATGG